MTYTIIGGDGKEYGLISGDDIRKWISENRLNAQSMAKAESDAAFRPLSAFPEFADAFAPQTPGIIAPPGSGMSGDWATRDYDLDIGDCISRGWNLFKSEMGLLMGSVLLGGLIIVAFGAVFGGITGLMIPKAEMQMAGFEAVYKVMIQGVMALVNGPILGGIFYVLLQRMRGRPAGVGDIFIGFQRSYSQLFLGNFVMAFLIGLCMLPFNIDFETKAGPLLNQFQNITPGQMPHFDISQFSSAIIGTLPVLLICMIPTIYLSVNWQFTLPLIIDKQMDFWDAMKMGFKKVHKHWWHVFGFVVVIGLINVAGFCICCIGLLFTIPMTLAATAYAYETIFGESQTA